MAGGDSVKVAVRVRPFNQREKTAQSKCVVFMNDKTTILQNPKTGEKKQFAFDHSYWSHDGYMEKDNGYLSVDDQNSKYADQQRVFADLGRDVLDNAWAGYNATLFAYGQTGSGKSYSMIGYGSNKGIVPIACQELFKAINSTKKESGKELQITFSMLEIYNEQTRDLLASHTKNTPMQGLKVRQNRNQSFYVEGLRQVPCKDYESIERLMEEGNINRTTASTNMNATSSRSHMLITIKFKQVFNNERGESTTKTSEINLVDLAGSERAGSTGAKGDRLKEAGSINQSLLTLGTIIKQLAMGNTKMVAYRNSVLTMLLKSALGGNSKTVMIAALSPADINYEETLSTLRYADQAKKIKNKAVINLSPTEKLIRDLKQENARLLNLLQSNGSNKSTDRVEVERLLAFNQTQMNEMTMSWEQKLEAAKREWEAKHEKTDNREKNHPFFHNVNEDSQLSGVIKKFIEDGQTIVGKQSNVETNGKCKFITFKGLGIQDKHCIISRTSKSVSLEPINNSEVILNGIRVDKKIVLKHADRVKLGSNSLFLYNGFPHERTDDDIIKKYDYDFFQNEIATIWRLDSGFGKSETNSNQNAIIYNDYLKLMPLISEANAISEELNKKLVFSLIIKNLVLYDSLGRDKEKEIAVKLTHTENKQVWIWDKDEFVNRKYLMEEVYQKFNLDPKNFFIDKNDDPFWDPVQDIYLGCGHTWLHALAYRMPIDEKITIHNHDGKEEGEVQINIATCNQNGELLGEESIAFDPLELKDHRWDVIVDLKQCIGLNWIKENNSRGIMLKYTFYNWERNFASRSLWNMINPRVSFKQQISIPVVDDSFLNYLQSHALVVELWGLQEGRLSTPDSASSLSPSPTMSQASLENECLMAELEKMKQKLKKVKDDKNEMAQLCKVLKKENSSLKTKLSTEKKSARNGNSGTLQAELGKALKVFFSDVKPVQHQLTTMKTSNQEFIKQIKHNLSAAGAFKNGTSKKLDDFCRSQDDRLNEVTENLNSTVANLKDLVAVAVRQHRNEK